MVADESTEGIVSIRETRDPLIDQLQRGDDKN